MVFYLLKKRIFLIVSLKLFLKVILIVILKYMTVTLTNTFINKRTVSYPIDYLSPFVNNPYSLWQNSAQVMILFFPPRTVGA